MQSPSQRMFLLLVMLVCTGFVGASLALIVFGGTPSDRNGAPAGYTLASAESPALPFITRPRGL